VEYFTKAIKVDPKDVHSLAIRSSAYQKQEDLEKALLDAEKSTQIDPTYVRGYIRTACVLRAQKKYSEEIQCYQQGLKHCPNDNSLQKGLEMAQRLTDLSSSTTATVTAATKEVALAQPKSIVSVDIASHVRQSRLQKELIIIQSQAQLALASDLSTKTLEDQHALMVELLSTCFSSTNDILQALQQLNLSFDISSQDSQKESSDDPLAADNLSSLVNSLATENKTTPSDIHQFLLFQLLFTGQAASIKLQNQSKKAMEGQVPKTALNDERMQSLFLLFDKDHDSTVDFKEVAIGLYPLTKSMQESTKNATSLLLLMDRDDQRVLSYESFAKLILAVAAAWGMTFDQLADKLIQARENGDENTISEEAMQEIIVAEEAYARAAEKRKEDDERKKTLDALSYSRTARLFELWDENGDGTIDFEELIHGLRRYQKARGVKNCHDVEKDALMIMGHDKDSNQALDPEEFAHAMANYAEAVKTDLHELIDFMCVVSSKSDNAHEYETHYEQNMMHVSRVSLSKFGAPSMGTIIDVGDDDDDEEEDDW